MLREQEFYFIFFVGSSAALLLYAACYVVNLGAPIAKTVSLYVNVAAYWWSLHWKVNIFISCLSDLHNFNLFV